jgi:UDPglucose 6-dehydrogenase
MARICIVGAWHQAVVLGACFAELGHQVRGVWSDAGRIARLSEGRSPVHEPGLEELLRRHLATGALRYTTDYADAVDSAEFCFLALDTPVGDDDVPQLEEVFEAAAEMARALRHDLMLCVTAQVPVGTCGRVEALVNGEAAGWHCTVAYVPEFLRLGAALETFARPDRIVIGCEDRGARARIAALYEPLGRPIVVTDVRSAEMAKHACNAFLAASVSFINEVATICDGTGANVDDVVRVMKLDRRIGADAFLSPGLGFAGGTLGREVRALQQLARESDAATPLLNAVLEVNAGRAALVSRRLRDEYGDLHTLRVGVLGLTYKPGTSTLRRSVALEVIEQLTRAGAEVRACDPLADFTEAPDLPDFALCADAYAAAAGADALVLLTEWPELRQLDWAEVRRRMRSPLLLDTRNFFDVGAVQRAGLRYVGIGRGTAASAPIEMTQAAAGAG